MIERIAIFINLMRPKQAVKSVFIFAPLFFSFQFMEVNAWTYTILATIAFTLATGAVYAFNDLLDAEEDKQHPTKKFRPIAAGKVNKLQTIMFIITLLTICTIISFLTLPFQCLLVIFTYILIQIFYTIFLKKKAILDVIIIALGFVIRVIMGGYAIGSEISPWIILTTFLLAMFLGFGKRYHEISIDGYATKRKSLQGYNTMLLDRLIGISCALTLMSYSLYTVETGIAKGKTSLVYTIIFVVFGLFRYLQILYVDKKGGQPEEILLKDKAFLLNCIIWLLVTLNILF